MKYTQTGAARTWSIAAAIILALVIWMLTGLFGGKQENAAATPAEAKPAETHFKVSVRSQHAEKVQREVVLNGDTQPDQIINIASQVEGQVVAIGARKGAHVEQGALLARVDPRDAAQGKARADAVLRQRELEYQGALHLRQTGYVTESELASRLAALEVARADLREIELRLKHLSITAPVSGVLEEQLIEVGDYAKIGQPVAKLIKIDPLRVAGGVGENDIRYIKLGDPAHAEILGQTLTGKVKFISALADAKTRTFTVEVAIDNSKAQIPAGVSARITLPVQEIEAQRVPTSLLALADDGTVGVKHVVDGKVRFTKADIVRTDGDSAWLSGLPETVSLITRGQGFVAAGEIVDAEPEAPAAATK